MQSRNGRRSMSHSKRLREETGLAGANAERVVGGTPARFSSPPPSSSSSLRGRWVYADVIVVVSREMWLWVFGPRYEMLVASGHGATSDREKPWMCMLMCADVGGEVQGVI